jgi:hypothetical protein
MPPTNPNHNRARQAPQVVTGLRSPDLMDARLGTATTDGRERPGDGSNLPEHDPIEVIRNMEPRHLNTPTPMAERKVFKFRSRNRSHMVLLDAYPDKMLPNGRIEKGKTILAKFKDNEYSTTNAEYAEVLRNNENFGLHGDYWDAEEEDNAVAVAQYNNFRDAVKSNPELYQRFMRDMAAGDFDEVVVAEAERREQLPMRPITPIPEPSQSANTDGLRRGEE